MKFRVVLVALLGLGLALYLLLYVGLGAVFSAALEVGWSGFVVLCLYALAVCALLGVPWFVLLPKSSGAPLRVLVWARMVREAATDVLPFSHLGGIVLGARTAILHGLSPPMAFASTIVDVTTEMFAQIAYIALGLALLSTHAPHTRFSASLTKFALIGLALAVAAGAVLLVLQRRGFGLTGRLAARLLPRAVAQTAAIGAALDAIYACRARVALSSAVHFAAWVASAAGTWLALRLIGAPIDFMSVIALESLVSALRSAAVFVPNALGVQEAAYATFAPLFGIGAQFGLAVSVLKRARDIAVGAPILLISQAIEGRRAIAGKVID